MLVSAVLARCQILLRILSPSEMEMASSAQFQGILASRRGVGEHWPTRMPLIVFSGLYNFCKRLVSSGEVS